MVYGKVFDTFEKRTNLTETILKLEHTLIISIQLKVQLYAH